VVGVDGLKALLLSGVWLGLAALCLSGCGTTRDGASVHYWASGEQNEDMRSGRLDALTMVNVSDEDIAALCAKPISSIAYISIRAEWIGSSTGLASITDSGIRMLAGGPRITVLELESQELVTAESIRHLLAVQQDLKLIAITGLHSIKWRDLHGLHERHPNVRILFHKIPDPPPPERKPEAESALPLD
jgi:hypothetical protein